MRNLMSIFFVAMIACGIFTACSKSDDERTPLPAPVSLTSATTTGGGLSGPKNTVVTFTGTGFPTDLTKIQVKINGKACTVLSATATTIQARVPANCGSGAVELFINSDRFAAGTFNYVYSYALNSITNGVVGVEYGPVATAKWQQMTGISLDASGNIYIGQYTPSRITKITLATMVSSLVAGSGTSGYVDGNGAAAQFDGPECVSVGPDGNLYVGDQEYVRKVDPAGNVTTLYTFAVAGAYGIKAMATGIYVAMDGQLSKISYAGNLIWTIKSKFDPFSPDMYDLDGDSSVARFNAYGNLEVDAAEQNIYFGNYDWRNTMNGHSVWRVKKFNIPSHVFSTVAGARTGTDGVDGPAAVATFNHLLDMRLDQSGGLWISDAKNNKVRYLKDGMVSTKIGLPGSGDVDGNLDVAKITSPYGLAFDAAGNLYIACLGNNRLKKLTID